jgi:L-fucose isomerase-like protein
MKKVKLGFLPSHRAPFSLDWAKQMRKRCVDVFKKFEEVEIITPDEKVSAYGLVTDEKDAKGVIEFFAKENIKGLVIGNMTFGEELPLLSVAEAFCDLPIFLFGTKEGPFTADGNRLSDSFCGTLSASSGLYRRKIPFQFAGIVFPEEEEFKNKVENFGRTCLAVDGFFGARIGQVGPRPMPFETCAINEVTMIDTFRQRVVPVTLAEIFEEARELGSNDQKVKKVLAEITGRAKCEGVPSQSLEKMAKLEVALLDFINREEISCLGVQCWTAMQTIYGISSCLTMGRLTEQGYPAACEVDLHGALTMLVQFLVSLKNVPPHFIDWTIQHQDDSNKFFAWHCGNAPQCLLAKSDSVKVSKHSILALDNSYGTAEFQLKEGVVTLNRLVEYDGEFKFLITKGRIVSDPRKLRGSWSWVEVDDLKELYDTLVYEGFIHHASMIHGDYVDSLVEFCRFTGIEPVVR